MSGLAASVIVMSQTESVTIASIDTGRFFAEYAQALLDRDEHAVAELYAVPALILFPGNVIPVSDASQTAEFFASSWSQYEGVREARPSITVMGSAPGTVWADVTWSYDGQPRERFCYQLVDGGHGPQIAVLTPMDLTAE